MCNVDSSVDYWFTYVEGVVTLTEKQFKIIGYDYTNIDIPVFLVECGDSLFMVYESKEDTQKVCDKLNKLYEENEQLKSENKRLTNKLNETALEFLNYDMVTMGKATEISEMCYYDFLKYRKENGNPMELQE